MAKMKILTAALVSGTLVFASGVSAMAEKINMNLFYDGKNHTYSAESVNIFVDGKAITGLDMPPVILNDRTLVPARAVFETVGADVTWNAETRQVYANDGENIIVLTIDSTSGLKNGESITMDVAPKIINDRTMIPIRYAAEAMNCDVTWDGATRNINIYTNGYDRPDDTDDEPDDNPVNPGNNPAPAPTPSENTIKVTGITLPDGSSKQDFYIKADGEITRYENFTLSGNRLVVDVYGADMAISNTNMSVTSPVVKAIRSAQFSVTPDRITRIVFDMGTMPEYTVSLSEDKTQIKVSFNVNYLEDLSFSTAGAEDIINIISKDKLTYDVYQNLDPNNVTVDIYGAVSSLNSSYTASGKYVNGINVSQTDSTTTRIVINTNDLVSFREAASGKGLTLAIKESTLKNISYNKSTNSIILNNLDKISTGMIGKTDKYQTGEYSIYFNGDYEDTYGYGEVYVNDPDGVNSLNVYTGSDGKTRIDIEENTILEFKVTTEGGKIYLKGVNPKELYDNIIVIDPGHGNKDPGASGNGITEKNANLGVIKYLNSYLENDSRFKVYATRLDDSYPANASRAKMGNLVGDLFISVHMNSAANPEGHGTEVLYNTHSNESETSGKVTSKIMATEIQKNLVKAMGTESRGIKSRPDLIVLNSTKIPAVLVEVCFISNEEDAAKIATDEGKKTAARAIYDSIVNLYSRYDFR